MNTKPKLGCILFGHKIEKRPSLGRYIWMRRWCARCRKYPCEVKR